MPMFEHASRCEPERKILVRRFGRRFVRQRVNYRALILVAVELITGTGLHVGVRSLPVAPACLLAVDHRPTQTTRFVISVEGGEIMTMPTAEGRVFLEESLLHIKTKGLRFVIFVVRIAIFVWKFIDLSVAVEHVE